MNGNPTNPPNNDTSNKNLRKIPTSKDVQCFSLLELQAVDPAGALREAVLQRSEAARSLATSLAYSPTHLLAVVDSIEEVDHVCKGVQLDLHVVACIHSKIVEDPTKSVEVRGQ